MPQTLAPFRIYDCLAIAQHAPHYTLFGREKFLERIAHTLQRQQVRHLILVGKHGVGKTMLLQGIAQELLERRYESLRALPVLQLDIESLSSRFIGTADNAALVSHFEHAITSLPPCLLLADNIEQLLQAVPEDAARHRIFSALTEHPEHQLILAAQSERWSETEAHLAPWEKLFETLPVELISSAVCLEIVTDRARFIAGRHHVQLDPEVPEAVVTCAADLPGPAEPTRSLHLLDEVCALAALHQQPVVTRDTLDRVVAQRSGQAATSLRHDKDQLRRLRTTLSEQIIGQPHIIDLVADTIERGWLGLKNPARPLGSFLFLGPSGVGKTEVARVLAREVYGSEQAFVRIDMSEYAEAHTAQRLLGAPPGYVGYEAGGQLTSAVLKQPFSLILLDEIEKADPAVFDIFLQILEDGRLTDGHGVTVDFRKTIIIATSNLGVDALIRGWLRNEPVTEAAWRDQNLLPVLAKRFRLEFLNRWEAVATFAPLSQEALYTIAQLELQKIAARVSHHNVTVKLDPAMLHEKIKSVSDPRFGARPLKRWLESVVEKELARYVLEHA